MTTKACAPKNVSAETLARRNKHASLLLSSFYDRVRKAEAELPRRICATLKRFDNLTDLRAVILKTPEQVWFDCDFCQGKHILKDEAVNQIRVMYQPLNKQLSSFIQDPAISEPAYKKAKKAKDASFHATVKKYVLDSKTGRDLEERVSEDGKKAPCLYPPTEVLLQFRSCARKKFYVTEAAAREVMNTLTNDEAQVPPLTTYICVHCTGWHYGHARIKGENTDSKGLATARRTWREYIGKNRWFLFEHGLSEEYVPVEEKADED